MPLEYRFECPLPNGLHARPASHLEAAASRFGAVATLRNERNGNEANVRSVLALIAADIRHGDPLLLRVEGGPDEAEAFAALRHFIDEEFAASDSPLPEVSAGTRRVPLPPSLAACAPERLLTGVAACRGLAEGSVVRVGSLSLSPGIADGPAGPPEVEYARFEGAVVQARVRLEAAAALAHGTEAEVLKAHLSLLKDVSLADAVAKFLRERGGTAAGAILAVINEFGERLRQSESAYLRERALDLQDTGANLLTEIYGAAVIQRTPPLLSPTVIVAESLTPGQFLALDRRHLRGVVLQVAGATSHTVILARAAGLPTLTGVEGAADLPEGRTVILDANLGLLIADPNEAVGRFYALEKQKIARIRAASAAFRDTPGTSRDGQGLRVLANVSSAPEIADAVREGAEGSGLFRTEILFMDRDAAPGED